MLRVDYEYVVGFSAINTGNISIHRINAVLEISKSLTLLSGIGFDNLAKLIHNQHATLDSKNSSTFPFTATNI